MGDQLSPLPSTWSPLEGSSYNSGSSEGLLYPGSSEQQQPFYMACGEPMSKGQAPSTPDSGCWEVGQENSSPMEGQYCQLDGPWSRASPESYLSSHPGQDLHQHTSLPELPALSLQEILGVLEGEWWEGDRLDLTTSEDTNVY